MNTKVVILNSPPNGGKDSVAKFFSEKMPHIFKHKEFKAKLFELTKGLFCISDERFNEIYSDRNMKEKPLPEFTITRKAARALSFILPYIADELETGNDERQDPNLFRLSVREAMIYTSEVVCKPTFGSNYFGIAAASSIQEDYINVFSDGGFVEELTPIIDKLGKENVMIVRIHREGCDFSGDSRDYLPDGIVSNTFDVYNNDTLLDLMVKMKHVFEILE